MTVNRKLTLDDILDLRAYERQRTDLLQSVIALKRVRRVAVGPILTFLFENVETIRSQIQEMARAERLMTDDAIETELRIYNPLIPGPNQLTATLFIELVTPESMREWLPKLVGVERSPQIRIGELNPEIVPATVDAQHASQLTREETTAAVHYIHFSLTPAQVERFASEPVALAVSHPEYEHTTPLSEETRRALLTDLRD